MQFRVFIYTVSFLVLFLISSQLVALGNKEASER